MKINLTKNPSVVLRLLLGGVFCSAGIFRLFMPQIALDEMARLGMSSLWVFPLTAFEIATGLSLLFNRYVKYTAGALILFLSFAIIKGLILGGKGLWLAAGELFVFNVTPTDIFMHLVFLVILVFLFLVAISERPEDVPSDSQEN